MMHDSPNLQEEVPIPLETIYCDPRNGFLTRERFPGNISRWCPIKWFHSNSNHRNHTKSQDFPIADNNSRSLSSFLYRNRSRKTRCTMISSSDKIWLWPNSMMGWHR